MKLIKQVEIKIVIITQKVAIPHPKRYMFSLTMESHYSSMQIRVNKSKIKERTDRMRQPKKVMNKRDKFQIKRTKMILNSINNLR